MQTVIIAARRTPVMPRDGAFSSYAIHELALPVIQALLDDVGLAPDAVDELILSNALGAGGNPARLAALAAGLPATVAGLSIDRQCSGGLDAIILARALVASGQCNVVIAGGVESYSRRPYRSHRFADGRPPEPYDQAPFTPWPDRDPDMADAANQLAEKLAISREEQDNWAVESHSKAIAYMANDRGQEVVEFAGQIRDGFTRNLTPALCRRAPIVSGDITAANMAVAADGAAFCLVVSDKIAQKLGVQGIEVIAGATLGADPMLPGLAPVEAIHKALRLAGLSVGDLSVAEIMEAFAVQAIACQEGAEIPRDIVNPSGGALARGHPVGASGAVQAVRLFHELRSKSGAGVAAIAAAGGLGTAVVLLAP
ncbi:thiolase family protein [Aliiroseovarius sp. 2305UL8-7]|uniref:thiolase family protein n=1 Tax=Aliiroseovarius conchicola TaxID=3121637 RepID=UPI003527CAD9